MRERLSLEHCRTTLVKAGYSHILDEGALKQLRDDLYCLADGLVEAYGQLDADYGVGEILERAAILELDAGFTASDAMISAFEAARQNC